MYTIPTKNKIKASHGDKNFDQFYFGLFFQNYSQRELNYYSRFFCGWVKYLNKFIPLQVGQGKKILEIGCGIGAFAKILFDRGFSVHATDISKFIIKKAQLLQPGIKFSHLNIEEPIQTSQKYDYIFAFEVVEHLKDIKKVFKNLSRLLKKDGYLVLSTPLPTPIVLSDPMHVNVHEPIFWKDTATALGFKVVSCEPVSFMPFLYRFSHYFSFPLPFPILVSQINTTCFLILQK